MLVRRQDEGLLAVGQASHAWHSGQLAAAWGGPVAGPLTRRAEVVLAATQHDVGMAEWDVAPALDPETGGPVGFMAMALDEHLRLWRAAPRKVVAQSAYAALLVSLHGTALYERRDLAKLSPAQAQAVRDHLAEQRVLQAGLAARTGADPAGLRAHQRLLFCWDALSLALCLGWPARALPPVDLATGEEAAIAYVPEDDGATLDPWPFAADHVEVHAEGRLLRERATDPAQLARLLAEADVVPVRHVLRPA